jgi:hypothetical protein
MYACRTFNCGCTGPPGPSNLHCKKGIDNVKYITICSGGFIDMSCGNILNVRDICGCSGECITFSSNLCLSCNDLLDVSNIFFCNGSAILDLSPNCLTISGCLDMSCQNIIDISQAMFCSGGLIDLSCGRIDYVQDISFCHHGQIDLSCGRIYDISQAIFCPSGLIDLCCGTINDVSYIQFCSGGHGILDLCCGKMTEVSYIQFCPSGLIDLSCGEIKDVSKIQFCSGGQGILDLCCGKMTEVSYIQFCPSGLIDLSCGEIKDVSKIQFCSGGEGILDLCCGKMTEVSYIQFCPSGLIDLSCGEIKDVSKIQFCPSGLIDLNCGTINDVSKIQFCPSGLIDLCCGEIKDVSKIQFCPSGLIDLGCGRIDYVQDISFCKHGQIDLSCGRIYDISQAMFCPSGLIDLCCGTIKDVSKIQFCPSGLIDLGCGTINDVSKIQFCSGGGILDLSCGGITEVSYIQFCPSGLIDLCCGTINDVSKIQFCPSGLIDLNCGTINDVSKIQFCSGGEGILDLCCGGITEVSYIQFCSGGGILDLCCGGINDVSYITLCCGDISGHNNIIACNSNSIIGLNPQGITILGQNNTVITDDISKSNNSFITGSGCIINYSTGAIAMGNNHDIRDACYGVAIGDRCVVTQPFGIAIGNFADPNFATGIAGNLVCGSYCHVGDKLGRGNHGIAIGTAACCQQDFGIAIGAGAHVDGSHSGFDTQNAIAIGYNTEATGANSIALGGYTFTDAPTTGSLAMGYGAQCRVNNYSMAIGCGTHAGKSAFCSAPGAIAMGCGTRTIESTTTEGTFAPNTAGFWGPPSSPLTPLDSTILPAAWGPSPKAQYSFAANYYSRIYPGGTCAAAFGCETWQDTSCGFSCGRYNDCSKNALFSVGCGDGSSNRQDALCIGTDCSTVTAGNLIVGISGNGAAVGNYPYGTNFDGSYAAPAKIIRTSTVGGNHWEDGWHGDSSQIVFLATDFQSSFGSTAGLTFNSVTGTRGGAVGWPLQPADLMIAVKIIPKGFQVPGRPQLGSGGSSATIIKNTSAVNTGPRHASFVTQNIISAGTTPAVAQFANSLAYVANTSTTPLFSHSLAGPAIGDGNTLLSCALRYAASPPGSATNAVVAVVVKLQRI